MTADSDNRILRDSFNWAAKKAKTFVVTGTKNGDINKGDGGKWYGPNKEVLSSPSKEWAKPRDYKAAFWAGYFDRTAYYIRDFVHQAPGAALLGMYEELFQMFKTFASNASEETGWYAPWAFNFDHSVYYMDTPDKKHFVREITSQFELVETAYRLYLLTGNERYITDDKISLFADKIMSDFIDLQDGIIFSKKNGIPEGKGDIFKGSATYNERGFHAVEASDSIAAMYAAMLCYSEILKLRGDASFAEMQRKKAEKLRLYFNNEWSRTDGSDMYCYAVDDKLNKHYQWIKTPKMLCGAETLEFIPLKNLSFPGERNDKLLDYIFKMQTDPKTRSDNIESFTYLPDLYFANKRPNSAWHFMKYIISQKDLPHEHRSQGTNGDYPEISFTLVSQTVFGLTGLRINESTGELFVNPDLPDEIGYINLYNLQYRGNLYNIEVTKDRGSVIKQI
ncbi:MAG: hypothetical protein MR019_01775 [Ruminococcus sp.]|nr:hypothetical protein [Ruminococcus sp.]MDY3894775.1 hypothetical protein [Candidatus Fimenecus sp.]